MPMMSDADKQEWAARTVAALYNDNALRQQFMTAYHTKSPQVIHDFLTTKIGMPDELATEVSNGSGPTLSNYIGQLVCDYLW